MIDNCTRRWINHWCTTHFSEKSCITFLFHNNNGKFGSASNRLESEHFKSELTDILALFWEMYQWFEVIHVRRQLLIDHRKHHHDRVQLDSKKISSNSFDLWRFYFFPVRYYSLDGILSMNLKKQTNGNLVQWIHLPRIHCCKPSINSWAVRL